MCLKLRSYSPSKSYTLDNNSNNKYQSLTNSKSSDSLSKSYTSHKNLQHLNKNTYKLDTRFSLKVLYFGY
jgi:hypothetical protein